MCDWKNGSTVKYTTVLQDIYLQALVAINVTVKVGIAQGVPCSMIICAPLCIPIWALIIPDSSTWAVWQLLAVTPSSKAEETWQ
jgi:hypothetical protein